MLLLELKNDIKNNAEESQLLYLSEDSHNFS